MASAAIFNPLNVTRRLKSAGFTEQQAEGIADTLATDALTELVTKTDLTEALHKVEIALTIRMAAMLAAAVGIMLAAMRGMH